MIALSAEMALQRLANANTDEEAAEPRAWLQRHLAGLEAHGLDEDAQEIAERMERIAEERGTS